MSFKDLCCMDEHHSEYDGSYVQSKVVYTIANLLLEYLYDTLYPSGQ